jgi:hypothetical protein
MLVGVLLYAYCQGVRRSRKIAQALERDMGFRVVVANQQPDLRTICRFRAEHEANLERLFVQVLRLRREAGLVQLEVVALDGTKVRANAALPANREYQSLEAEVRKILAEAKVADEAEDAQYCQWRNKMSHFWRRKCHTRRVASPSKLFVLLDFASPPATGYRRRFGQSETRIVPESV